MYKKIIVTVFIALSFLQLNAQSVDYGVKTGANISFLSGTVNVEVSSRTSFHLGAFMSLGNKIIRFQPEIVYSGQGAKFTYRESNPNSPVVGETVTKLNYLNVPLLGKLYLGKVFNLQFGPQIGLLLSAKEVGEIYESEVNTNLNDQLKKTDFSIVAGIGGRFSDKFNLDLRLANGLSDLNKTTGQISPGTNMPKTTNLVFQISLGVEL